MSRCDIDLWSLDLELSRHFDCNVFKLFTKFERNWIIHRWIIDDFNTFTTGNFKGWGISAQQLSGVRGPNFTKLGEIIGRLRLHKKVVSELGYLAAFSNSGGSKLSDVKNDATFRTFWHLWKLGEGWARFLNQLLLLKVYLRPNLRNTYGHPLRGCWARWIDIVKVHG